MEHARRLVRDHGLTTTFRVALLSDLAPRAASWARAMPGVVPTLDQRMYDDPEACRALLGAGVALWARGREAGLLRHDGTELRLAAGPRGLLLDPDGAEFAEVKGLLEGPVPRGRRMLADAGAWFHDPCRTLVLRPCERGARTFVEAGILWAYEHEPELRAAAEPTFYY